VREFADQESPPSARERPGVSPGASPTDPRTVLDLASALPWLTPSIRSLTLLARPDGAGLWPRLRTDPGAVLLVARTVHGPPAERDPPPPFSSACEWVLTHEPALLEEALRLLEGTPAGFIDWDRPAARPVYAAALASARRAHRLARQCGRADPEQAWACGLLAPLGRLALCALGTHDPAQDPDPAVLARRLAGRWGLPPWLAAVAGHLALPVETAAELGADPALFRLTRLAVTLTRRADQEPWADGEAFLAEDARALGLSAEGGSDPGDVCEEVLPLAPVPQGWEDPYEAPWLRTLLQVGAENRRLRGARRHAELEQQVDRLHGALRDRVHTESARLRERKLEALAEFAAGAGHEINNPLAVISGQAQYLLRHLPTEDESAPAHHALHVIVGQTMRIHGILRDLMQFARPRPPDPGPVALPALMGEVAESLRGLAGQRQVRLEVQAPERLTVHADGEQLRTVLVCLLRNAVEAAPAHGWARLRLEEPVPGACVEVAVEDSGPGPAPEQRPALFDPFYSGRTAGRGRGLGLPLAWRLARLQGGDVRLEPEEPGSPTCFLLTLPAVGPCNGQPES
jgi:two-component system NtrC family sensor kinase